LLVEVVGVISNQLAKATTLLEWAREGAIVREKDIKKERAREKA
jgi:hypothetical protein